MSRSFSMRVLRALAVASALAITAGCVFKWRKYGDQLAPDLDFARRTQVRALRAPSGAQRVDDVEFTLLEGSFTKVFTAFSLEECRVFLRMRVRNLGSNQSRPFTDPAVRLLGAGGREIPLSGPYGCGDGALAAEHECLASLTASVLSSQCATPTALVLGQTHLPLAW